MDNLAPVALTDRLIHIASLKSAAAKAAVAATLATSAYKAALREALLDALPFGQSVEFPVPIDTVDTSFVVGQRFLVRKLVHTETRGGRKYVQGFRVIGETSCCADSEEALGVMEAASEITATALDLIAAKSSGDSVPTMESLA